MHRPQNILDSVSQCQQLPAPKGDGEEGSHTVHDAGFDLEKQKQKIGGEKAGWELYCENPSCHDILLHTLFQKPTQTQRPTKTVYRSGPEYYTKLLFTAVRFDQNGYNRLYFAKPASKILAVVACSAILTYVTLVS